MLKEILEKEKANEKSTARVINQMISYNTRLILESSEEGVTGSATFENNYKNIINQNKSRRYLHQ